MTIDRIFPNFKSITLDDIQQGDLILNHSYGKVPSFCFIVKPLDSLIGIVNLFPKWELKTLHPQNGFIGYKLFNEWRIKCNPMLPISFKSSLLDAPIGSIAVCEQARVIVCGGQDGFGGYDSRFINIDEANEILEPSGNNKCFYSNWAIQIREGESEEWQEIYDPFGPGRA